MTFNKLVISLLTCCLIISLISCGGRKITKPAPAPPVVSSPDAPVKPANTAPAAANNAPTANKPGGYYLDDGPGDNPPKDIDGIPNATPKKEALIERANKPYKALGTTYTPMTSYQPYKLTGVASWYGKRYHGKSTSSGEVYDMYSMTAAHPTLPLPSYVKVTNIANGRWVIVRVNDRGPFKSNRIIDLSYAAAYKLRFSNQGSSNVEVESIDASKPASYTQTAPTSQKEVPVIQPVSQPASQAVSAPAAVKAPTAVASPTSQPINNKPVNNPVLISYFVQAGAFKSDVNADLLMKKIQALDITQNAGINSVYNNGLYRLKLGPYDTKQEAEQVAATIRKQLNTSVLVTNQ